MSGVSFDDGRGEQRRPTGGESGSVANQSAGQLVSAPSASQFDRTWQAFARNLATLKDSATRSPELSSPRQLEASEGCNLLDEARGGVSALAGALAELNIICEVQSGRPGHILTTLVQPLLARAAAANRESRGMLAKPYDLPPYVDLFVKVLGNYRGENSREVSALAPVLGIFDLLSVAGTFPNPTDYVNASSALREERRRLHEQQRGIEDEGTQRQTEGQKAKLMAEVRRLAESVNDVDPGVGFTQKLESVGAQITLSPVFVESLVRFRDGLSSFLLQVVSPQERQSVGTLSVLQFQSVGSRDDDTLQGSTVEAQVVYPSEEVPRMRLVVALTDTLITVRDLLFRYEAQHGYKRSPRKEVNNALENIRADQSFALGKEVDGHLDTIFKQMPDGEPKNSLQVRVCTAHVISRGANVDEVEMACALPRNMRLYALLAATLLSATNDQFSGWRESFCRTTVRPLVDLCDRIRAHREGPARLRLVDLIDGCLQSAGTKPASNVTSSDHLGVGALVFSIETLLGDRDIAKLLRNRLRNVKVLDQIADSIGTLLGGRDKDNVLASAVRRVRKGLKRSLDDYVGAPQLVENLRNIFGENSRLLGAPRQQVPDNLRGLTPREVILNGFYLIGPPGVGKTFLVECIATSFDLEQLNISPEEMQDYVERSQGRPIGRAGETATDDLWGPALPDRTRAARAVAGTKQGTTTSGQSQEPQLAISMASFMQIRLQELRSRIERNNAAGGIVFLDELEEFFPRRDRISADPVHQGRTATMLRVVEDLITSNPDIYFFGATNFPELVDIAAIDRVGRFGLGIELELVTFDSAAAFLVECFNRLGLRGETFKTCTGFDALRQQCVGATPEVVKVAVLRSGLAMDAEPEPQKLIASVRTNLAMIRGFMRPHRRHGPGETTGPV